MIYLIVPESRDWKCHSVNVTSSFNRYAVTLKLLLNVALKLWTVEIVVTSTLKIIV